MRGGKTGARASGGRQGGSLLDSLRSRREGKRCDNDDVREAGGGAAERERRGVRDRKRRRCGRSFVEVDQDGREGEGEAQTPRLGMGLRVGLGRLGVGAAAG